MQKISFESHIVISLRFERNLFLFIIFLCNIWLSHYLRVHDLEAGGLRNVPKFLSSHKVKVGDSFWLWYLWKETSVQYLHTVTLMRGLPQKRTTFQKQRVCCPRKRLQKSPEEFLGFGGETFNTFNNTQTFPLHAYSGVKKFSESWWNWNRLRE